MSLSNWIYNIFHTKPDFENKAKLYTFVFDEISRGKKDIVKELMNLDLSKWSPSCIEELKNELVNLLFEQHYKDKTYINTLQHSIKNTNDHANKEIEKWKTSYLELNDKYLKLLYEKNGE